MDYETEDWTSGIGYLAVGAGIGAALGMLFAPKAGKALRGDVNEWLHDKRLLGRRQARVMQDAIEKGRRSVARRTHRAAGH